MNAVPVTRLGLFRFRLGSLLAKIRGSSYETTRFMDTKSVMGYIPASGNFEVEEVRALVSYYVITRTWTAWWMRKNQRKLFVVKVLTRHKIPLASSSRTIHAYEVWNQYVSEVAEDHDDALHLYMDEVRHLRAAHRIPN